MIQKKMTDSVKKLRDTYAIKPGSAFYQTTFGLTLCLDHWYEKGGLDRNANLDKLFLFDEWGFHRLTELGWCEAAFEPVFEEKIIEDRGRHEVVQDFAGRKVLYFKGKRHGFMPEYIDHPVKDMKTWQDKVKWRLNPETTARYSDLEKRMDEAKAAEKKGLMIQQNIIGGYMYLRSLMGPEDVMYVFYDNPDLVHDCMETWFNLVDAIIARHQQYVTIDELFMAEDICYNHGLLVSPGIMKEFLLPYYQQLITNIKNRQLDKARHLYVQVDTDGNALPAIEIYREAIGMDVMSPFEVASGCDVVILGKQFPWLVMSGGIDKRVLAQDLNTIDKYLESILPVMRERGGYIPTCDHCVPPEVPWQNYLHYRKRCVELGS